MSNRLGRCKSGFLKRVGEAEKLVHDVSLARHATLQRLALRLSQKHWMYEIALLKLLVGSERFFEDCLGFYAMGERSPGGYRPRRRRQRQIQASHRQVLATFRADRDYGEWSDPQAVIERADCWLVDGRPFRDPVSGTSQLLTYLRHLRNVIAHESGASRQKLRKSTRRLYGAVPRSLCPGQQLASPGPTGISFLAGGTLFDSAVATFRAIAGQLVP